METLGRILCPAARHAASFAAGGAATFQGPRDTRQQTIAAFPDAPDIPISL